MKEMQNLEQMMEQRLHQEMMGKKVLRDQLEEQTKEFLEKGGKIEKCKGRWFHDEVAPVIGRPVGTR